MNNIDINKFIENIENSIKEAELHKQIAEAKEKLENSIIEGIGEFKQLKDSITICGHSLTEVIDILKKYKKDDEMKYFYEYKYKNDCKVSGHNLEKIELKDDYVIITGIDFINYASGVEEEHWCFRLNMNEIKYFKIEPMKDYI